MKKPNQSKVPFAFPYLGVEIKPVFAPVLPGSVRNPVNQLHQAVALGGKVKSGGNF
jgi:hypothetical protein